MFQKNFHEFKSHLQAADLIPFILTIINFGLEDNSAIRTYA